jgi:FkbM family methyltransferase
VFEGKRARIEPYGLSSARGVATLRLPYDASGSPQFGRGTIDPANQLETDFAARVEEVSIETRTVDEYAFANVGFIKIDVEGHELAVLHGAEQTIRTQRPCLLVESTDDHQPGGVAALIAWMREREYDVRFLAGNTLLDADQYNREEHWTKHTIENFIGVHRSRGDVIRRLGECAARASAKGPARSKPPKPRDTARGPSA